MPKAFLVKKNIDTDSLAMTDILVDENNCPRHASVAPLSNVTEPTMETEMTSSRGHSRLMTSAIEGGTSAKSRDDRNHKKKATAGRSSMVETKSKVGSFEIKKHPGLHNSTSTLRSRNTNTEGKSSGNVPSGDENKLKAGKRFKSANQGCTQQKFNPFENCPPLTPNIDINRLYPRINQSTRQVEQIWPPDSHRMEQRWPPESRFHVQIERRPTEHVESSSIQDRLILKKMESRPADAFFQPPYFDYMMPGNNHSSTWIHPRQMHPNGAIESEVTVSRNNDSVTLPSLTGVTSFERGQMQQHPPQLSRHHPPPHPPHHHPPHPPHPPHPHHQQQQPIPDPYHSPPRYQCDSCLKSYSTVNGLSKHREFHCPFSGHVRRDHRCQQCDKVYNSLSALKMHIRTHTLPCRCKLCGKAFSRPWLLQGHLRTHTGEKPFHCSHCGRAFADRSNLRAHLQTHYDVKQYSCNVCQKTFSRMSLLLKHQHNTNCV